MTSFRAALSFSVVACIAGLALGMHAAQPVPVKRIYLAPDDHTDYLWTMDEEGYRRAFLEMLDDYMAAHK